MFTLNICLPDPLTIFLPRQLTSWHYVKGQFKDDRLHQKCKVKEEHNSTQNFCQPPALEVNGCNDQDQHTNQNEERSQQSLRSNLCE